jgi:hypothetical protein
MRLDAERERRSVVVGRRPRFYGGSLLKVQFKELMSGDFLPKRKEETPKGALFVCFVAILRARNVEEEVGA